MEAFLVKFEMYVLEDSLADVHTRTRVWQSLAKASGFEAGQTVARRVQDGELPYDVAQSLEKARRKDRASDHARKRAVEALATHLMGDLDLAGEVVESIERETGRLPASMAAALSGARRPEDTL